MTNLYIYEYQIFFKVLNKLQNFLFTALTNNYSYFIYGVMLILRTNISNIFIIKINVFSILMK